MRENQTRDRFKQVIEKALDEGFAKHIPLTSDYLTDCLIESGAMFPPCKIGDKVYRVAYRYTGGKKNGFIIEVKIVGFHLGDFPALRGHKRKNYLIGYSESENLLIHIDIDKIGKSVFFSPGDAQKVIDEEERNG